MSSIPVNGIFLTKNKKKMPDEWKTIKSLVHKIRLPGIRPHYSPAFMFPPKRFGSFPPAFGWMLRRFRCRCCCCLHIKNRYELYQVPFSFLVFRPTLMGTKTYIRKWTKSVFFIREQKYGQADSYENEKPIRNWTKSVFFIRNSTVVVLLHQ